MKGDNPLVVPALLTIGFVLCLLAGQVIAACAYWLALTAVLSYRRIR